MSDQKLLEWVRKRARKRIFAEDADYPARVEWYIDGQTIPTELMEDQNRDEIHPNRQCHFRG